MVFFLRHWEVMDERSRTDIIVVGTSISKGTETGMLGQ